MEGKISRQDMIADAQRRAKATGGKFVSDEAVQELIKRADYWAVPNTTTTVCCLTLKSGFTVVGHAACIDPKMYEPELGLEYAYSKAVDKLYELLAFHVCEDRRP